MPLTVVLAGVISLAVRAARLGSLKSDDTVFTPTSDVVAPSVTTKDGYPVFEIHVPDGTTEVQVRASLSNFEPGFLLKDGDQYVLNYIPTGEWSGPFRVYHALGTDYEARWNTSNSRWEFGYKDITSNYWADNPWDLPTNTLVGNPAGTYATKKEYFVYRFCTTGIPSDPQWGIGSGDPDAWVYFANQGASPGDNTEFQRQRWNPAMSLTSQLQPGGTPGSTILFQPGRGNLGASEWMQQNQDKLVWVYQVESPGGKPKHPNGSDVWSCMHPVEWRKNRITLP